MATAADVDALVTAFSTARVSSRAFNSSPIDIVGPLLRRFDATRQEGGGDGDGTTTVSLGDDKTPKGRRFSLVFASSDATLKEVTKAFLNNSFWDSLKIISLDVSSRDVIAASSLCVTTNGGGGGYQFVFSVWGEITAPHG